MGKALASYTDLLQITVVEAEEFTSIQAGLTPALMSDTILRLLDSTHLARVATK